MVQQQELKSYELLSSYSKVMEIHTSDPKFDEMWYIVSEYTVQCHNIEYQFIEGLRLNHLTCMVK